MCPAYISKIDSICEKQVILSMIPNDEKEEWHYRAIFSLSCTIAVSCTQKNVSVNKRRTKNVSWCKSMLCLRKKNLKQAL